MMDTMPAWLNPESWIQRTQDSTPADVERALTVSRPGVDEFAVLLSPAAEAFLEPMAQQAQRITQRHFGRTVSIYAPLYLSNYCGGGCVYCGFASDRKQPRSRMTPEELEQELEFLYQAGFEELLLLTGERTNEAGFPFLEEAVQKTCQRFHDVKVETFSMTTAEYQTLHLAGCTGVTVYQETYHPDCYQEMHLRGEKKSYEQRLSLPTRALEGEIRTIGMGVLLGLTDHRYDALALFRHISHLQKKYWRGEFSVSFPRIRDQQGHFKPAFPVSDQQLAQLIFAFRICMPTVPLVLSTREPEHLRDGLVGLGITKMSAGSKTSVGGYTDQSALPAKQFDISDQRDLNTFCAAMIKKGVYPVLKNWDASISNSGHSA